MMGPREGRAPSFAGRCRSREGRASAPLLALLATAIAVLALSGTAAATPACAEAVLDDWFDDGRMNQLYELACYEEAIHSIPIDIRDYSNAEEVIALALQAATRGRLAPGDGDPSPGSAVLDARYAKATRWPGGMPPAAANEPSGASSIPVPLLVLGGLSLALLTAGGVSNVRRRVGRDGSDDRRP